ncbi:UNVERIFIED_CONTAM: Pentatricopeptide repeat-containing protein, mitochondrial [Sesamum angustifolium]|uniref:Pentatricopeptide repeat-containing protein, mitochondrial n=1 Tax=Sesamum angustifolium TaxID=2727405 RepID=A0AAW2LFA0_9LAMI
MALSKLSLFNHLTKTLTKPRPLRFHAPPPAFLPIRLFSFATPEEAAAERRKRKRRLRIEPPLSALRHQQQQQPRPSPSPAPQNPNAPKLPEPVSALSGNRLNLHNRILKLIRENDLEEAALLTRHSIYSNCRPTIYTCNSVMAAQLRQLKYSELLSLHRFITQAGVAANVVTHNLLLTVYLDCRKTDLALEQYKQLINDAPFNPSPTTYRILIKGLVDNQQVDKALEIKDEMETKGFKPDPTIYSYLMLGQAKNSNAEGVFELYEELKQKIESEEILDGVVYEALSKHGKFEEALNLFQRMKDEHDPPRKLSVNLGSYNIIVDGYCAEKRFSDAIEVFNSMGEKRCSPDTLSYNVLIDQLCSNDKLAEAEELYKGMGDKKVSPDEYTFVTLMDTCFKENRPDDAAQYFRSMVEAKLRPNLVVYNRLVEGLVKVGKHDEVLKIVDGTLREDPNDFSEEVEEFVREGLRKEGREDEVTNLKLDIEREKAEAAAKAAEEAERAKASARAAVASLLPSKLFGDKGNENNDAEEKSSEASEDAAGITTSNNDAGLESAESVGNGVSEQGTA